MLSDKNLVVLLGESCEVLATPMEFQRLLALELLWSASLSDFSLDASLDRRPSDLHLFLSPSLSLIGSTTLPAVRCFVSLAMLTMSQLPHQASAQGSRPTEPNRDTEPDRKERQREREHCMKRGVCLLVA